MNVPTPIAKQTAMNAQSAAVGWRTRCCRGELTGTNDHNR